MHTNSELSLLVCACMWLFAAVLPPCSPSRGAMSGGVTIAISCVLTCAVCTVRIPSGSRVCMHVWTCPSCPHINIRNITHARVSLYTAPSWHGLWLRLIENTTPARGALASALATRSKFGKVAGYSSVKSIEHPPLRSAVCDSPASERVLARRRRCQFSAQGTPTVPCARAEHSD